MSRRHLSAGQQLFLATALWTGTAAVGTAQGEQELFTQQPTVVESQVSEAAIEQATDLEPKAQPVDFAQGPQPQWIWGSPQAGADDEYFFRKEFTGGSQAAHLIASCDNVMTIFVNGQRVASSSSWQQPVTADVQKFIQPGKNVLLVEGANEGGAAGLALKLVLEMPDDQRQYLVTDSSWQVASEKQAAQGTAAAELGPMGIAPWGNVFANPAPAGLASAARDVFNVLPGFQIELLYTVPKEIQGSWVCMTFDHKGRIIASDQQNLGLYRITPAAIGSDQETKVEKLDVAMTAAQGMVYAFDSLYLSVNGGPGSGFYRLRDTNGDDQYDEVKLLKRFQGGGEHGPHAVRLSPDGESLYVVCGNHTDLPHDFYTSSAVPTNWDEDLLLPRQWDARGHARGRLAPGGWIAKTDPEGKQWEVVSIGYRNAYDMVFNEDGELFAYDADMEWDMGTPWYRPTRAMHATSGSEFGWRSGTGKWPSYYVDSLPPLVELGPGSPTGVSIGTGARFPAAYQRALYLMDWTFGTIYAVHLTPEGSTYRAEKEEFLSRTPLPLTDGEVGPDGALYFTVGGRGTQSELYRVTYIGEEPTDRVNGTSEELAELRNIRRDLETFHGHQDPRAVEAAWPYLSHDDRFIRYAARVAIEHQDVNQWQARALAEKDPQALIQAAVALARQGDPSLQDKLLAALERLDFPRLSEPQRLDLLRAYSLVFIRMGQPDDETAARIASRLAPYYPADSNSLNRELCTMLVYLNSPTVIGKTLALMEQPYEPSAEELAGLELLARNTGYGGTIAQMLANQPEIQKIHYAFALRNLRYGWTLEQRKTYFEWFNSALTRSGGASYEGFIENIREEALENASPAERQALESTTIAAQPLELEDLPKPEGPGKDWTVSDVLAVAESGLRGRSFENGQRMYAAARCAACHRFDGEGGNTGPDLSNLAGRFNLQDLTESIVEPSKVISDQYQASVIITDDGRTITGRVVGEEDGQLTVLTDAFDPTKSEQIDKESIEESVASRLSLMPTGLLNDLNEQEVLDLLAYLLSRGNPNDRMFAN